MQAGRWRAGRLILAKIELFVENNRTANSRLTRISRLQMSNPDGNREPGTDDVHVGYSPEQGVLSRFREWTDVFGWLRLVRVLRIAGSPIALGMVSLTSAVWSLAFVFAGDSSGASSTPRSGAAFLFDSFGVVLVNYLAATPSSLLAPSSLSDRADSDSSPAIIGFVCWSVLVWTPTALYLMRQGALLTAGRNLDHARLTLQLAMNRTPQAWLVATMPLVCGLLIGACVTILGFASRIAMGVPWIEMIFAAGIAIVALSGGILLFGANFAVPLGWAALINEQQADALDSLSRGMEYLYRRPLQLAMYLVIAAVPLGVTVCLGAGITASASHLAERMLLMLGASQGVPAMTASLLSRFPSIVAITVSGGLIGGIYLLLRSDAGGQEVEDIWTGEPKPTPPLPELPTSE